MTTLVMREGIIAAVAAESLAGQDYGAFKGDAKPTSRKEKKACGNPNQQDVSAPLILRLSRGAAAVIAGKCTSGKSFDQP